MPEKKTTVTKTSSAKTSPTKRSVAKGESYACDVCGLSVVVDEIGGYVEETTLLCCGKPMKQATRKAKVSQK